MKKKAISEEFSNEQNKALLKPLTDSSSKIPGGAILFKSIEDLEDGSRLKAEIEKVLSDAKLKFPFNFEKIPLIYLVSQSSAKRNVFYIREIDPKTKTKKDTPIYLLKKFEAKKGDKTEYYYDYINLETGQIVYARSAESARYVEEALEKLKKLKAAQLYDFLIKGNQLIREKEDRMSNIRMSKISQGDVSNLIPSIGMLQKCLSIINDRIEKFESMVKYFSSKAKEEEEKEEDHPVFSTIDKKIKDEILSVDKKFIKSESDAIKALLMKYRGKSPEDLDAALKAGELKNLMSFSKSIDDKKLLEIVEVTKKLLTTFADWDKRNREKRLEYKEEREESSKSPQPLSDEHPIFGTLPYISYMDFTDRVPGGDAGHHSFAGYIASLKAKAASIHKNKLEALKTMKIGVEKILSEFEKQKSTGKLSVYSFSSRDIDYLKTAYSESLALMSSYKSNIITKEGKVDKRIIGSVFQDAAIDMFLSRYIAIVLQYIIMVFNKSYR